MSRYVVVDCDGDYIDSFGTPEEAWAHADNCNDGGYLYTPYSVTTTVDVSRPEGMPPKKVRDALSLLQDLEDNGFILDGYMIDLQYKEVNGVNANGTLKGVWAAVKEA